MNAILCLKKTLRKHLSKRVLFCLDYFSKCCFYNKINKRLSPKTNMNCYNFHLVSTFLNSVKRQLLRIGFLAAK